MSRRPAARTTVSPRSAFVRVLSATEARRGFHDRVLDGIRKFFEAHAMQGKTGAREFYEFEKALHERLLEAEREIVADVMGASDVEADALEIEGRVHRRVLRSKQTYMTACGEVQVDRWLHKDRADPTAHALSALDLRLGIVEGFWTQRAAQQASWVVTQMTPKAGEELFERVGNMEPSKSSLDRLPKALGERWEAERESTRGSCARLSSFPRAPRPSPSRSTAFSRQSMAAIVRAMFEPTPPPKAGCAKARSATAK